MDLKVFVPLQAVVACVAGIAAAAVGGHAVGLALLIVTGVGISLWAGFGVTYAIRVEQRDDDRRELDRRAASCGVLGLIVPAAAAFVVWRLPEFASVAGTDQAAAWAIVSVSIATTAILASSMVDWYLILPFLYGVTGPAPWTDDPALTPRQRRMYAKVWVAHRGLCEIAVFICIALLLAIVFVAVGNAVADDGTLPGAIESLGGAGIAFSVLGFLGPRVRHAFNYVMAPSAGLGTWASGTDSRGEHVEGLVVDVSIHPGVKVRRADGAWRFVPLASAEHLQELDGFPEGCDEAWRERSIRERRAAREQPHDPLPHPPEPIPEPAA